MNLILISGQIKNIQAEDEKKIAFTLDLDDEIHCYIVFKIKNKEAKEKLKQLLNEKTNIIIEGSIEEYPELPEGLKIRVKKFNFLQSLHEKLEEAFMTFDEFNSLLDEEIENYLKEERDENNE